MEPVKDDNVAAIQDNDRLTALNCESNLSMVKNNHSQDGNVSLDSLKFGYNETFSEGECLTEVQQPLAGSDHKIITTTTPILLKDEITNEDQFYNNKIENSVATEIEQKYEIQQSYHHHQQETDPEMLYEKRDDRPTKKLVYLLLSAIKLINLIYISYLFYLYIYIYI
jgi:hypothetical protein